VRDISWAADDLCPGGEMFGQCKEAIPLERQHEVGKHVARE
jgi:hypothetical protein